MFILKSDCDVFSSELVSLRLSGQKLYLKSSIFYLHFGYNDFKKKLSYH